MNKDNLAVLQKHLDHTLQSVEHPKPKTHGKVRDIFEKGNEIFLVASDRVSAFDVILGTIPLKGAMLTHQACFWLDKVKDIVPTHLIERPDAQIMRCHKAQPLMVEMVVRGYLAGSLAREPAETRGEQYGLKLDPNIQNYQAFETPIITPTTKAEMGEHDAPCAMQDLINDGALTAKQADELSEITMNLFNAGQAFASEQDLILVDTKYEFGLVDNKVILIDEIHTADSSRYWKKGSYDARLAQGEAPDMLDKERLRRWLMSEHDYKGNGPAPALTEDIRLDLSSHYWELTELLTGASFDAPEEIATERVTQSLAQFGF
jgi:phosphoribosylaminoimidazole-succinocarboxamide synthase